MDNFTIAVIVGDIVCIAGFLLLVAIDRGRKPAPAEPPKPAGKRPA